ncbi:MAG: DUF2207 domain-containing protein [Candidatus Micrarchaeota archaeon]|nr:DUF2207 domain-containing protein [Candidatus Micrarchaeota archaeon]
MKAGVLFLLLVMVVAAKDFSIEKAYGEYTIFGNGTVHVHEAITYSLYDCNYDKFRELYLQKPADLKISGPRGWCEGAQCTFRVDEPEVSVTGDRELINELVGGGCGRVTSHFEYDVKAIDMHNDTAQFYYILWGDKWEKQAPLETVVKLPGKASEAEYFVHYRGSEQPSVAASGDEIKIKSVQQAGELLEINLLMPTGWFEKDGDYYYDFKTVKEDILNKERDTAFWLSIGGILQMLAPLCALGIAVLPLVLVALAYALYGRELSESDVGYAGVYERDLPSKHSPVQALMLVVGDELDQKNLQNAILGTIMSLVDKGYIELEEETGKKGITLLFKDSNETLYDDEKEILEYLKGKASQGRLRLESFSKDVAPTREFYTFINKWKENAKKSLGASRMIDSRGYTLVMGLLLVYTMVSFFTSFVLFSLSDDLFFLPKSVGLMLGGAFCISYALSIAVMLTSGLGGKMFLARWTREGRLLNLKWSNFKKYITDYSALEEHPPASIKLWDQYMVYAVALGVAQEAIRAMGRVAPTFIEQSRVSHFCSRPHIYTAVHSGFRPTYTPPSARGGGGGGFGGGHGGGGGGAR